MNSSLTALVTGASSGIGYELAKLFAKEHYNIIIIGRNELNLQELATLCRSQFNVEVLVIVKDLATPQAATEIMQLLDEKSLLIDILINNAGEGLMGEFCTGNIQDDLKIVQLQINFMLTFTKLVLRTMLPRRSGKILNISSVYGYTPIPFQSVYSASKAFITSFSSSLRAELKNSGITVCQVCPGTTLTQFRSRHGHTSKKLLFAMSATQVANIAYAGLFKNKAVIIPGTINKIYVYIGKLIPTTLISMLIYNLRGLKVKSK